MPAGPALPPPRRSSGPYRVCLVCLGNICRSPMAEVALRAELDRAGLAGLVEVDSAGTGDWHLGEPMRDLVLAMDLSNLAALRVLAPDAEAAGPRLLLFRSFDPDLAGGVLGDPWDGAVPDPYGGPQAGYAQALDLVQGAVRGLVGRLAQLRGTAPGPPDGVPPGGAAPDGVTADGPGAATREPGGA